jgi:hypothetical protein
MAKQNKIRANASEQKSDPAKEEMKTAETVEDCTHSPGWTKRPLEQILAAIRGSGGNKSKIARSLHVERGTVDHYLERFALARRQYTVERDSVLDMAEDVIVADIKRGNVETAKWHLRMQGKDRGYVDRQEIAEVDPLHAVRKVVFEVAQPLQGVEKKNGDGLHPTNGNGHKPALEGNA